MRGYFRKRGSTWSYTIDVGVKPDTGERDQRTKGGFRTKKEAELACAALLLEYDQGTYTKENNILFKDYTDEWLVLYENTGVKITSIDIRKYCVGKLKPYFAHIKLRDVTRKKYQDALNDLKDKKYSNTTLSNIHSTAKMLFKKAVELSYIKVDPTQYASIPKTSKTIEEFENEIEIPKYLEKEELVLFLNTAKEKGLENDYVFFRILAYSGLRIGELCALMWKDIDFENQTIRITKTYYNKKRKTKEYVLHPPKTKKSRRTIVMDDGVLADLEKLKLAQNIYKMEHRDNYHDKDFVFINKKEHPGYPLTVHLFDYRMKRILRLAKLNTNLTPHSLRHTHTSLLAEAGVGLEEIMDRLGHKNDITTRAIYLHVTKTMKKEASQKFSALMRGL